MSLALKNYLDAQELASQQTAVNGDNSGNNEDDPDLGIYSPFTK